LYPDADEREGYRQPAHGFDMIWLAKFFAEGAVFISPVVLAYVARWFKTAAGPGESLEATSVGQAKRDADAIIPRPR